MALELIISPASKALEQGFDVNEVHKIRADTVLVLKTSGMSFRQWILRWLSFQPCERLTKSSLSDIPDHSVLFPELRASSWESLWTTRAEDIMHLVISLKSVFPSPSDEDTKKIENWLSWVHDVTWVLGQMRTRYLTFKNNYFVSIYKLPCSALRR